MIFFTQRKTLHIGLTLLLLSLIGAILILASVPPVSRDALVHHLALPKLYLQGGIREFPELVFSYYPMNLDLLYMIPLALGKDIWAQYIHFSFALFTAGLIYGYLHRTLNRTYALLGALFFLSIPIIAKLSTVVYVDLGLVFFSTASLLLLLRWAERDYQIRFLLLAGLCSGLAAGVKYNGLITLVILTLFVPLVYRPQLKENHFVNSLKYCLLFLGPALLAFSPWLIRNYLWTGNPLYPFFGSLFARGTPVGGEEGANITVLFLRKAVYHESWLEIFLLPLRIFFTGQDDSPQQFDGRLNPFLLILPLLLPLARGLSQKIKYDNKFMAAFSAIYFLIALFHYDMRVRYIAPIFPFLVILGMQGLCGLNRVVASWRLNVRLAAQPILAGVIFSVMIGYNFFYIWEKFGSVQPWGYLRGHVTRDQYITRFRPEYPLIQYANNVTPARAKILAVFLGNRGYYFDRPVRFDLVNGKSLLGEFAQQASTPEEIAELLKKSEITHLLIRYDMFFSWINEHLSQPEAERLQAFFQNYTLQLTEQNGHGLFQLVLK